MVGTCRWSGCQGYLHSAWHLLQCLGEPQCQGILDGSTEPLDSLLDFARGHCRVRRIQPCVGCGGEVGDWCRDRVPVFQAADALLDYRWHTCSCKDVKQMEAEGDTVGGSGHTV